MADTARRTVLVVDDEAKIREILRAYLERDGFAVVEAGTGNDALTHVRHPTEPPDLILLDVGLPDIDGLEVLRQIRTRSDVYVVLVTARAEEMDMLVGLSVGADDYITKPFSPREVVARVKTVLRRARPSAAPEDGDDTLRFDGLTICPTRREITQTDPDGTDRTVTLSTLEFDLLSALAASPGRVFSRSQLLQDVWGYDYFGDDRVVDVHIRSIRKALGDDASDPTIVGTVRGVGYRFLLPHRTSS